MSDAGGVDRTSHHAYGGGLIIDLTRCHRLGETLVVWKRRVRPHAASENGDGRSHNPHGFTMWMAGGGVAATWPMEERVRFQGGGGRMSIHDLHATIPHAGAGSREADVPLCGAGLPD